jgi:hypothetical protein
MCSPSISTFIDPIGTLSKSVSGAIGGPLGTLVDPVGAGQRAIGSAVGGVPGAFLDPGRIATAIGSGMEPKPPQATGGVQTVDGGGPGAPSAVYQPSANTYAQGSGQDGALNTYVLGMNKARRGAGDVFTAGVGEDVLGPFNQGGQKAVKKIQAP